MLLIGHTLLRAMRRLGHTMATALPPNRLIAAIMLLPSPQFRPVQPASNPPLWPRTANSTARSLIAPARIVLPGKRPCSLQQATSENIHFPCLGQAQAGLSAASEPRRPSPGPYFLGRNGFGPAQALKLLKILLTSTTYTW